MDPKGWLDVLVLLAMVAMAIDRWIHGRSSKEVALDVADAGHTKEVHRLAAALRELDEYAHKVGTQGHLNASDLGKLRVELTLRAAEAEREHERLDRQIRDNTIRIDEVYRVIKRNGAGT